MRFRTVVELGGKTATGIRVPPEVVASLRSGKRPPVRVTIKGHTYRSTVAIMGGAFMIGVSAEVRRAPGSPPATRSMSTSSSTPSPAMVVPPDLAAALDGDPDARRSFDGLSYSNKRRLVTPINDAKTTETRQRRIATTVSAARGLGDGASAQ